MRPLLNYFGSKWLAADWIISNFPPHKIYVEGFGGSGAVLLKKTRSDREILNDRDGEIVNLYQVARDRGPELREALRLTPFARDEYHAAFLPTEDPLERARRTIIKAYMGVGNSVFRKGGLRVSRLSTVCTAKSWSNYIDAFDEITARFRGVLIENLDWFELVDRYDAPNTLFYFDPPYVHDTRLSGERYRYDWDNPDHLKFIERLKTLTGSCIVSGYDHPLYTTLGWEKIHRRFRTQNKGEGVEVLWFNQALKDAALPLLRGQR